MTLSPQAQALLDRGREALTPSAQTKEQVLASLDSSLAGVGAGTTATGFAASKLWLALALVAGIGGGWFLFHEPPTEPVRHEPKLSVAEAVTAPETVAVVETVAVPEPVAEPATVAVPETILEAEPEPVTPTTRRAKKRPSPATDLLAERKLIAEAQRAIRAADYAQAHTLLAKHARLFSDGLLSPERQAASAIANCLDPEGKGGKAIARRFLSKHESSPLAPRVRKSCEL